MNLMPLRDSLGKPTRTHSSQLLGQERVTVPDNCLPMPHVITAHTNANVYPVAKISVLQHFSSLSTQDIVAGQHVRAIIWHRPSGISAEMQAVA